MAVPKRGSKVDKQKEEKKKKPREHNPRWFGYTCIMVTSLVSFSAISNVIQKSSGINFRGNWSLCLTFGVVTFTISLLVLFFDRLQIGTEKCGHFFKAMDGKLEGFTLLFMSLWCFVLVLKP